MKDSFNKTLKLLSLSLVILGTCISSATSIRPIKEVFEPQLNYSADQYLKVAVIQWAPMSTYLSSSFDEAQSIKAGNRSQLESYIRSAAANGAKLIVASELAAVGYPDIPHLKDEDDNFQTRDDIMPFAESIPGESTDFFSRLASELGVYIQYGDVELKGEQLFNVAVAIDPSGKILAVHRKNSLYHIETAYFTPGEEATTYWTPAGLIGILICADVYDYALLDKYRNLGVNVLALSTSWAEMNTGWSYFTKAAKEVGAFLLAANQPFFPDSGVINPTGSHQSHIRQTTVGIAYGYLPLQQGR